MKIAMCQMKMSKAAEVNEAASIAYFEKAAAEGANLIVFPELQLTYFFPQYEKMDVSEYRMTVESPFIKTLQDLCKKNHMMSAPNVYLEEKGKVYDATILIGTKGEILGIQKMIHIAQAENFYEQDYYTPGDDGFYVFNTEYGRIGIVVCFDRHYPESIRTEALMGADLILIPTANTREEPSEMFEWEIRVQAFQNSVAIAMCNRVGQEGRMDFSGESVLIDAKGNAVLKADNKEGLFTADIDLTDSARIRAEKPYTNLRRTELYK